MQLTDRDMDLLSALARLRAARTSDLIQLCFAGVRKDTAAARLRRLFDSGHLAVQSAGVSEENVYRLGAKGRRMIEQNDEAAGRTPRGNLEHHLAIVSVWVALANLKSIELVRVRPDWELRERQESLPLGIIPDLLTVLRIGKTTRAICVEVDLGSESIPALRSKLVRYSAIAEPNLTVAIFAPEAAPSRANAIRALLQECPGTILWQSTDQIGDFLHPLTESPYSNGSEDALTEVIPPAPETTDVRK